MRSGEIVGGRGDKCELRTCGGGTIAREAARPGSNLATGEEGTGRRGRMDWGRWGD